MIVNDFTSVRLWGFIALQLTVRLGDVAVFENRQAGTAVLNKVDPS